MNLTGIISHTVLKLVRQVIAADRSQLNKVDIRKINSQEINPNAYEKTDT